MSDTLVPSSPTRPGRRRRVNHCSRRLRRATDPRTALPGLGDAERARTQRVVYRTYCAASRKRDGGRCSREVVSSAAASRNSFSRSAEDCLASHRYLRERPLVLPRPGNLGGGELATRLLAAAVARGQEPLALPAPLPVFFITGPQLVRDAPLLILYIVFVYIKNITSVY